jgi:uncharacterized membrane protein
MPIDMDFAHIHLLLNHLPIIGTMIGIGLFITSFFANTQELRKASLIVLVAMALLSIPTFVTGVGAQTKILEADPQISNALIQRHEGSAELALWFMIATGGLATIALWQSDRARGWTTAAILLFSLITLGLMARTGNTGGEIRHSEVRASQETGSAKMVARLEPSPPQFTHLMIASKWWWAFMMDMHFIGLVMLIGTIGLLDLRVLGFAKQLPIGPLNKLVPLGLTGLGINIVSGMLAFIGMSTYYIFDIAFVLKMGALLLAVAALGLFYITHAFDDCETVGAGQDAPFRAKVIAGASLFLWLAVIVLGRYIQPLQDSINR